MSCVRSKYAAVAVLVVACSRPHETARSDPPAPSAMPSSVPSAIVSVSAAAAPPPAPPPPPSATAHAPVVRSALSGAPCAPMCSRAARCHLDTVWGMSECMDHCAHETWAVFCCLDEARTCEQINECMDP